jgi:hypothetical protein
MNTLEANSTPRLANESDTESYNDTISSDSDSDYDTEQFRPKYCIGLCILWCKDIHGFTQKSTPNIETHWLLHEKITLNEFFQSDLAWIEIYRRNIASYLSTLPHNLSPHHALLRNYTDIVSRPYNPKIDIVLMEYLPGHEAVAYIKTFWLRLIQKRWKQLYQDRCRILQERRSCKSLTYREIHGKWPLNLNNLPNISQIINF